MIRIPDALEIGGICYVVEFVDNLPQGRVAQIEFLQGKISVMDDMADEVTFLSFMHEVVHGVMQSMNHFPCDMVYNDEDFTERFAQLMTSIFKQVYDYNRLYDEYFAPQTEELKDLEEDEKDVLTINVEVDEDGSLYT